MRVDRKQLENSILNMVVNERDAMSGSGRLTIRVSNGEPANDVGGQVRLSITDTGCGMTPEVLDKIFDPFYTTKAPGEGLGTSTSMVYGFVNGLGYQVLAAEGGQQAIALLQSGMPQLELCIGQATLEAGETLQ